MLGTFAAATIPLDYTRRISSNLPTPGEVGPSFTKQGFIETTHSRSPHAEESAEVATSVHHDDASSFSQAAFDIEENIPESSFNAYPGSDFEESSASCSSSPSSSDPKNRTVESELGSFAAATTAISIADKLSHEECKLEPKMDVSGCISNIPAMSAETVDCLENRVDCHADFLAMNEDHDVSFLSNGTDLFAESNSLDNLNTSNSSNPCCHSIGRRDSVHLIGISQILSESEESCGNSVEKPEGKCLISLDPAASFSHGEAFPFDESGLESKPREFFEDQENHQNQECDEPPAKVSEEQKVSLDSRNKESDKTPKETSNPKCLIVIADELDDQSSCSNGLNATHNGDWSHALVVSQDGSADDSSVSESYDDFNNSLSLSWLSEEDSATNAIDWAICREVNTTFGSSRGSI